MALLGIDVSNNNPNVNMVQAKAQGVGFVIAKASQGWAGGPGGFLDWTWVDIVTRAKSAGLIPGGYHWALKGNGAAQAHMFVTSLQRAGGPQGFLCAIDIERNDWDQSLNVDVATVDSFLAEWDILTNHQPILLYGASWYQDGYMHAGAPWANRPLWCAQYTGVGPMPIANSAQSVTPGFMNPFGGWTSYAVRQFTSNAIVGGQMVDANISYLSPLQLQAMTHPPSTTGGLTVADAVSLSKQITALGNQLVTVVQGVPPGHANPYGIVGTRDLLARLEAVERKLGITP